MEVVYALAPPRWASAGYFLWKEDQIEMTFTEHTSYLTGLPI